MEQVARRTVRAEALMVIDSRRRPVRRRRNGLLGGLASGCGRPV